MTRKHIAIGRREIAYLDEGAAGGTLVLIHAFPLNADMWAPQFAAIPQGWRFVAPDLRGFGESGAHSVGGDAENPSSVDDHAADILSLLDRLKIGDVVVCGLSMGGYISFAMFRLAPGRFRGIVLADTRSGADSEEGRANRRRMQALVDREGTAAIASEMVPKLLGGTTHRTEPALVEHVSALVASGRRDGIRAALDCMMNRQDSTSLLATIQCPALVIVGEEDTLTPVSEAESMHAHLPDSTLAVLTGAGHLSNLERPDDFNRTLADFLSRRV